MSTKMGVARGTVALAVTRMAMNLLNLGSIVVLARLLTPGEFGLAAIVTTALGIAIAVSDLSLGSALIQRAEVSRAHVDTAFTLALIRAAAMTACFAAAAWPLSVLYGDPRLLPAFAVAGLTGGLMGLVNPSVHLSTKQMQFRPLLTVQLVQKSAQLLMTVGIALWFRSFFAIVVGNALGALVAAALSYLLVPYRPRLSLERRGDILGFSSWLFLGQLANVLNWRLDQLLIGVVLPKAQLGAYAMADTLAALPSREATAPFTQALFPGLAKLLQRPDRLRAGYLTAQSALAAVALPGGIGVALLADLIVPVALGPAWGLAVPVVQVLAVSYAIQTLTAGVRPLAMAMGETRALFRRDLLALMMRLPTLVLGLLVWGLPGVLWGRLITTTVGLYYAFSLVRDLIGLPVAAQMTSHLRTITAVAAMVTVLALARLPARGFLPGHAAAVELAVLIALGAVTYVATLGLLWQMSGRRDGAEAELLGIAQKILARG